MLNIEESEESNEAGQRSFTAGAVQSILIC